MPINVNCEILDIPKKTIFSYNKKNDKFLRFYWPSFCCWCPALLWERGAHSKRTVWRFWILSTQRSLHDDGSEKTKTDPWRALAEPLPANVIRQAGMICSFSKSRMWNHQAKQAHMDKSLSKSNAKELWLERLLEPLQERHGLDRYKQAGSGNENHGNAGSVNSGISRLEQALSGLKPSCQTASGDHWLTQENSCAPTNPRRPNWSIKEGN